MAVHDRINFSFILAALLVVSVANPMLACAQSTQPASAASLSTTSAAGDDEQDQLLVQAAEMIKAHHPAEAIAGPIAQVIAHYENGPGKDRGKHYYCARSQVEVLLYMAEAAKDKQSAVALPPTWANAYFMKGNALIDMGRLDDGRAALRKATDLSPWNSAYLSELAYTYEQQHDLAKSLDMYQQAEAAANFSPDAIKTTELTRALRGEGFALTDMHHLDEAESKYNAALKLDPDDEKSKHEIEYIQEVRAKSALQDR